MSGGQELTVRTWIEAGDVIQEINIMGETTRRVAETSAAQFDAKIREALIAQGWTPPSTEGGEDG